VCCSRAVLIVGLGADFPQIVLRAGVGAGMAATRLRLAGSNVTVLGRGLGWDGSTRRSVTVVAKNLATVGMVVDPANQLLPCIIFLRRSQIPSQDFAGMADGRMCEFGQLAVHSPVTWYRRHIGRSVLATWWGKLGQPTTLAFRSPRPGLKKSPNLFPGGIRQSTGTSGLVLSFPFPFPCLALPGVAPVPDSLVIPVTELLGVKDSGSRIDGTTPFRMPFKKLWTWSSNRYSSRQRADLMGSRSKM
jgi:hypothetical protein